MKHLKLITIILFVAFAKISVNAQTIVWNQLASLPTTCAGGEAVILNDKIYYVASSHAPQTETSDFYMYNISENTWDTLANMPEPRGNLALAEVSGKIYAIGGSFTNTNYEYTPETNTWQSVESMPTMRQHIDCGVVDNKIFVIGGITSFSSITKKNEMYDPITDSWEEKASIPTLRNNPAIVSLDSLIYVIGGGGSETNIWTNIDTVESYNTNTDSWTTKSNMPQPIFKPGAVVVNNKIFVLGGQNSSGASLSSVLVYNPENDTWEYTTPLPMINCFAGYVSVGNKIYVIGGTTSHPSWTYYSEVYEGTVYDPAGTSDDIDQNESNLSIFPNPTIDKLNISFSGEAKKAIVEIRNLEGKIILKNSFNSNLVIDLSGNERGIYLMRIFSDNEVIVKKICLN